MDLKEAYEIINKCLKKDPEFKCLYDSKFTVDFDENDGMVFMLSKQWDMSEKFKKILGEGSVQICYENVRGGSVRVLAAFEFDKWQSKIRENVEFAQSYLGYKFNYRIDDQEYLLGYDNEFQISRDNVDGDLEKEIDELFLIFAFALDA